MGCLESKETRILPSIGSLEGSTVFTPDEIDTLRQFWPLSQDEVAEFGAQLFQKFFDDQKQLVRFFRRMTYRESGTVDFSHLATHGSRVVAIFLLVIENVDNLKNVEEKLRDLGKYHYLNDVSPDLFYFLWPPLRDTLTIRLGEAFDHNVEITWKHLFDYVAFHMTKGVTAYRNTEENNNKSSYLPSCITSYCFP